MWKLEDDNTPAVITAEKHIESSRKGGGISLPETALLFYMHSGVEYTLSHYDADIITERFPSFLNSRPVYRMNNSNLCFLHGGWGAPMAVDTLETLVALGVKNIVSVGMFGAFSEKINSGDIVVPDKAFIEEGTSLHYFDKTEYSQPGYELHKKALHNIENSVSHSIVSTDAVYRQTFCKEDLWRSKGAVGVDMETSALFSVGKYLGVNVVSVLIASDKHPKSENEPDWKWTMTSEMRYGFFDKCINFALELSQQVMQK